ncbi:MAG: phytase [Bacteroidales bacterium]|nr:phytase [Bacteroidales bacterium]
MRQLFLLAAVFTLVGNSCKTGNNHNHAENTGIKTVCPVVETVPVHSTPGEDAADDPAVYINPTNPAKSWIIGTNKKAGLHIYDLQGNELNYLPVGLVNNVDVRYGFTLKNGQKIDLAGASNRSFNGITLLKVNVDSTTLDTILASPIISNVDEVYGFCMCHNATTNKHYAIVNGKNGQIEQWELMATENHQIEARLAYTYKVPSQPEGMVADDENGLLYVGEENHGIWRFELGTQNPPAFVAQSDTSIPTLLTI